MNLKINLLANLLEYQNVRDVEGGDEWVPNDEETSIPFDMENVNCALKYIKKKFDYIR